MLLLIKTKDQRLQPINDHKDNYKGMFKELLKKRFVEIKELNNEINQNDLMYYYNMISIMVQKFLRK